MAVAKRQRKEKNTKIEQRKVQGLEWEPQVTQTVLLASPVYIGQAQSEEKEHIKRGAKIGLWILFLCFFRVSPPSHLEDVFSFACQIKLTCNTGPSCTSNFCCGETEWKKLHTPPTPLVLWLRFNLAETPSAWSLQSRWQTQQKPN